MRSAIVLWATLGVAAITLDAVLRLAPRAVATLASDLTPTQWMLASVWTLGMIYGEGYRVFTRSLGPRLHLRARAIARRRRPVEVLLAPLVCLDLVCRPRAALLGGWRLVAMIIGFVLLVRQLPAPWRGIVDIGAVAGLGLGSLGLLIPLRRLRRSVAEGTSAREDDAASPPAHLGHVGGFADGHAANAWTGRIKHVS